MGASTFDIWLAGLELVAVSRADRALLISGRPEAALWVDRRYGRLLASFANDSDAGRVVRVVSDRERQLLTFQPASSQVAVSVPFRHDHQEVS